MLRSPARLVATLALALGLAAGVPPDADAGRLAGAVRPLKKATRTARARTTPRPSDLGSRRAAEHSTIRGLSSRRVVLERPSYLGSALRHPGQLASALRADAAEAAGRQVDRIVPALRELDAATAERVIDYFVHDYVAAYFGEQHRVARAAIAEARRTLERRGLGAGDRRRAETDLAAATELERTTRLIPIGGRLPLNAQYAGQKFPASELPPAVRKFYPAGVRFSDDGFPVFTPYAKTRVRLAGFAGDSTDFTAANRAAGLAATPAGYTWHHTQDGQTLELIPSDLHAAIKHTGGAAIARYREAPDGYWALEWDVRDAGER